MRTKRKIPFVLAICTIMLLSSDALSAGQKPFKGVRSQVVISASPAVVYQAIRALRILDPSGCKEISKTETQSVVEEQFEGLPIIGTAKCTYVENFTPCKGMEYHMLASDKFKVFEGSWVITPLPEGKTVLELSSYVDAGLPVPFARQITNAQTLKDIKDRLSMVKDYAESRSIAGGPRPDR